MRGPLKGPMQGTHCRVRECVDINTAVVEQHLHYLFSTVRDGLPEHRLSKFRKVPQWVPFHGVQQHMNEFDVYSRSRYKSSHVFGFRGRKSVLGKLQFAHNILV